MQGNGGDAVFSLTHVADDLAAMMVGVTTAGVGRSFAPSVLRELATATSIQPSFVTSVCRFLVAVRCTVATLSLFTMAVSIAESYRLFIRCK